MAQVKLSLPLLNIGFYGSADRDKINAAGKSIMNNFQSEIQQAAFNSNVNEDIIKGFIFVESAGDPYALGGRAVGLMQIDATTADETIWMENSKHRLNDKEKVVLSKRLGLSRLNAILKTRMGTGASPRVMNSDLFNPEFNIQIGTILLGLLIDEHTENGYLRLDKVVLRYNRGYYFRPASGTPDQVYASIKKINKISADYVIKIAGTNNVIDLMA